MKWGKVFKAEGVSLPDRRAMKSPSEGHCYKYMSVLQAKKVEQKEMKKR